jgi:hypothetical protein
LEGDKHYSEARIARNNMLDLINVKVFCLSTKANPFLDEAES